jgi:hypothetical protein
MSLCAISSVLMTFFGVNYFLSGLHSYGSGGDVSLLPAGIAISAAAALIIAAGVKFMEK